MKTISLSVIFTSIWTALIAQSSYPASAIASELLKNADAVVRKHELVFNVINKAKATQTEHMVVTLLNENASELSEPVFYYYEFEEIEEIEASVFDSDGKLVRNLKKKDIEDGKPLSYFVNDYRYKVLHLPGRSYPYTIEYIVQTKLTGLMFYPVFQPQDEPSIAVEYASFEVTSPPGLEVRFKEVNLPEGSKTGPQKWELKNIQAFKPPSFASNKAMPFAKVISAPTLFTFGGIDGDMSTWESFGLYMNKLNESQQSLPGQLKRKLEDMVKDCPDAMCKIERVYEFLQSNTRYFYIGMGIGGWQPAPASKVDEYKYGDCKGLSNYTVAMLNAVGVPARYSLIRAGGKEQDTQFPDFPNAWFNHAIVCVPLENDTVWLECTSQTESCGFMGTFTDNRLALMVTAEGGKVMHTPVYDETQNLIHRTTNIQLNVDGTAHLYTVDNYAGVSQSLPAALEELHDEERRKYLYKLLNVNNFEIKSLSFLRTKARIPNVEQQMELSLPNFAAVNGKRLFIPLSVLSNKRETPLADSFDQPFFQPDPRGFTEIDSILISVPSGFGLESQQAAVNINNKFGSYQNEVKWEEGKLRITRKLVVNAVQRPKEDFADFAGFLKSVAKADKTKIVLVKAGDRP